MLESDQTVDARVIDVDTISTPVRMEVEYRNLISVAELSPTSAQPLPTRS